MADVVRLPVEQYPDGFRAILSSAPMAPWIYTGGLENSPRLLDDLAQLRPLWGVAGASVRACRDPLNLHQQLRANDLPALDIRSSGEVTDPERRWLLKPMRGSGGGGIRFAKPREPVPSGMYAQAWVEGRSISAVYCSGHLLGVSEQFQGVASWGAPPFAYCGNIGPLLLPADVQERLREYGRWAYQQFALRGLFGIDYILQDSLPWLLEINPRYTASIEVLERTQPWLILHAACFQGEPVTPNVEPAILYKGKAILYARVPGTFHQADLPSGFEYSDIPEEGEPLTPGWPICTLKKQGPTFDEVRQELLNISASGYAERPC